MEKEGLWLINCFILSFFSFSFKKGREKKDGRTHRRLQPIKGLPVVSSLSVKKKNNEIEIKFHLLLVTEIFLPLELISMEEREDARGNDWKHNFY